MNPLRFSARTKRAGRAHGRLLESLCVCDECVAAMPWRAKEKERRRQMNLQSLESIALRKGERG
jgi:hypothetical protein